MKTLIILTVIGSFGGERYSYAINVPNMDQCYDMVSVEMERNSDTVRVTDAVCNEIKVIEK